MATPSSLQTKSLHCVENSLLCGRLLSLYFALPVFGLLFLCMSFLLPCHEWEVKNSNTDSLSSSLERKMRWMDDMGHPSSNSPNDFTRQAACTHEKTGRDRCQTEALHTCLPFCNLLSSHHLKEKRLGTGSIHYSIPYPQKLPITCYLLLYFFQAFLTWRRRLTHPRISPPRVGGGGGGGGGGRG